MELDGILRINEKRHENLGKISRGNKTSFCSGSRYYSENALSLDLTPLKFNRTVSFPNI